MIAWRVRCLVLILAGSAWTAGSLRSAVADETPNPVKAGTSVLDQRLRALDEAIAKDPNDKNALLSRAKLRAAAGKFEPAIEDCNRAIVVDPNFAEAYDERGSCHFMNGDIARSIDDFDRFLQLKPAQEPWHWKRGISYYYAGRFDEGSRQFEAYQTVADNDVENAAWRYLCMARNVGVNKARENMLVVTKDPRVPMSEIYLLYSGKLEPADVLTACSAASPPAEVLNARLFYAHLYLGLYYEVAGDAQAARQHITTAAERHKIGHYMWNVADVHARRLKDAAAQ